MVQIWYMDDSNEDQRLEHHRNPPKFISQDDLYHKTGVEYFKINENDPLNDSTLNKLKKERDYSYEDEITCSEQCLPNYHEKLKNFFTEHLHTDEEIRLVLEGSGYFDVRDPNDEWIRICVTSGDLIIIPAGIYHRFTLDSKHWIIIWSRKWDTGQFEGHGLHYNQAINSSDVDQIQSNIIDIS